MPSLLTVHDPRGYPPKVSGKRLAPRLEALDGKTVYLVDCLFDNSEAFMEQLRLWFASMAYVLICALRRIGLANTRLARASCATIRLKLFKIGALVTISVRRIKLAMNSACPFQREWALTYARLAAAA